MLTGEVDHMAKTLLITGASGFLGRALVKEILSQSDDTLHLLVRSGDTETVLTNDLGDLVSSRVHFVRGDITESNCGVPREIQTQLKSRIDELWHLAASTTFDDNRAEEIRRVNVGGTQNVISLARHFDKLCRFYYMSTAYVCGKRTDVIDEDDIDDSQGFKNVYEKTKWESEGIVRASGLPFTIIRPSILIGDSRNGDSMGEARMMYGYLLALYHAARHAIGGATDFPRYWHRAETGRRANVNARLYGAGEVTKNMVTVDDVVRVCMAIRASGGLAEGQTFNVVNSRNLPIAYIVDSMQRALRLTGYYYDASLPPTGLLTDNKVERAAYRCTRPFFPYARYTEPSWVCNHRPISNIPRVAMTEELFDLLMCRFVEDTLVSKPR
jgi:nucleoside-diphosphate-sugar epimerase